MKYILLTIDWDFFEMHTGGEHLSNLLWCVGIITGTLLLKKPLTKGITYFSARIAARFGSKTHLEELRQLIRKPVESLLQTMLFYVALNQMSILLEHFVFHRIKNEHEQIAIRLGDVIDHIFLFFTILFTTLIFSRIVDFIYHVSMDRAVKEQNREKQQLFPLVKEVSKLGVWTLGFFWALGSVFHVNIPTLIAGFGIGGVAIALAAKESVENLFAAFTLLSDKPFQTGDTIKIGDVEGTIERIGFRSTRLRNADGSIFVIPNQKLVNENLENLTQRDVRRVKVPVSVKYRLSYDQLQKMMAELNTMLRATTQVITPAEVTLDSFGENSFQMTVVYHLPVPLAAGASLSTIKHDINMKIFEITDRYSNPKAVLKPASPQKPEGGSEQ
ncbi:mechanosensitive ion channel family protein [Chitinophagaceae bacterium MMS25-I14]